MRGDGISAANKVARERMFCRQVQPWAKWLGGRGRQWPWQLSDRVALEGAHMLEECVVDGLPRFDVEPVFNVENRRVVVSQ